LSAMRDERLVYLKKLGADGPVVIDTAQLDRRKPKSAEARRPRASFTQEGARKLRLRFRKTGPAAFLSHLDLLRVIPRLFRRLELPLFYSQGFHPKPEMVFGPALSLGVASLCEHVDLKLVCDVELDGLAERLTAQAPAGLVVESVVALGAHDATIAKLLADGAVARYAVGLPRAAFADHGFADERAMWREIEGQLEGGALTVRRSIDGIGKTIRVRDYLVDVRREHGGDALAIAGVVGDLATLQVDVRLSAQGGVKIGEVVEALLGPEFPYRAVRAAMWTARGVQRAMPTDLDAVAAEE
ncbi:MAG: TIGR03936 family radical SAM-associated protein, partial [Polyangiales bacterium]